MAEIDPQETGGESSPEPSRRRRISLLGALLLAAVVALAAYVGVNVLSVLFAVVAPPLPPMPPDITQTSHENVAYGVDRWRYTTSANPCALVVFLEENGGVCQRAPMQCAPSPETTGNFLISDGMVARCNGTMDFSIFTMTWFGLVIRSSDTETRLDLDREVYWLGTGPQ